MFEFSLAGQELAQPERLGQRKGSRVNKVSIFGANPNRSACERQSQTNWNINLNLPKKGVGKNENSNNQKESYQQFLSFTQMKPPCQNRAVDSREPHNSFEQTTRISPVSMSTSVFLPFLPHLGQEA